MSCFEWRHREEHLDTMWDKMKREATIYDEIIFLYSEFFLSIIENSIDHAPISLSLSTEIHDRDTSLLGEFSHEVSC